MVQQTQKEVTPKQSKESQLKELVKSSLEQYTENHSDVGQYYVSNFGSNGLMISPSKQAKRRFTPKTITLEQLELYERGISKKYRRIFSAS